ncbi:LTA synthase family protein [Algoriphagus sp. C2-6-M1]|uniref:LTA synthase family protein n=1 Tax=Algoriphagus persicinus TaxID=3108754 RepID=UPI002B3C6A42|nr:LTA synthase family protein [Algoriphagus sp. C2-6-M1]MEB2780063.1 LTA synthase family protein [Algoriphagus sp. C2-6-M1]
MAQKAEIRSNLPAKIQTTLNNFWSMTLIFSILMFLTRAIELVLVFNSHAVRVSFREVIGYSLYEDLNWILYFLGLLFILHVILSLFSAKLAKWFTQSWLVIALLTQTALIFYFLKTLLPLGNDLFAYNLDDIILTLRSSGLLNFISVGAILLVCLFLFYIFHLAYKLLNLSTKVSVLLTITTYWFLIFFYFIPFTDTDKLNEEKINIERNKSKYLSEQAFDYFMYQNEYYFDFYLRSINNALFVKKEYTDPSYPFLHTADYPDVLSPYFDSLSSPPDIVFVIIESIGKAYSGKDAYLGSFTPFLDSLESHSLVWTNAISSTGRTFGILPGLFAGLPFGEKGFQELYEDFPHHQSLISVLNRTGYESSFFIGSDVSFDHQKEFLENAGVSQVIDIDDFDPKYKKMPPANGFTWGYGDKEIFSNGLSFFPKNNSKPQLGIFQTITSHDPYLVPEREFYSKKFEDHLENYLKLAEAKKTEYRNYQDIYMTILYADDAVRDFITSYSKKPEFANTIFVFTGDHRLPDIPMASRLDRFHVPLIIYSPLITRPAYFKGIISHFEVTPSFLAFLHAQLGIQLPEQNIWMGQVLDTSRVFQSQIAMPLMRNKNQLMEYIDGEFFLSDDQLFAISDGLNIDPIEDQNLKNKLTGEFEDFKNKNSYTVQTRKLLPLD